MSKRKGWIKIHRRILDNPIAFKDPDHFTVWMYLLLEVAHEEYPVMFGGKKVILKPGQVTKGRVQIARETGVEQNKVYRILKLLESEHQIEQQKSNKCTLITVLNWEQYQHDEQQPEQQVNNNRTTSEQQLNTKQECKELKNNKNIIYTQNFEAFWKVYPRKKDKGAAFKKYCARINSGFSEEQLLEAAKKYASECEENETEQKYIKHAATFLGDNTPFTYYLESESEEPEETTEEFYERIGMHFPPEFFENYTDEGTVWEK